MEDGPRRRPATSPACPCPRASQAQRHLHDPAHEGGGGAGRLRRVPRLHRGRGRRPRGGTRRSCGRRRARPPDAPPRASSRRAAARPRPVAAAGHRRTDRPPAPAASARARRDPGSPWVGPLAARRIAAGPAALQTAGREPAFGARNTSIHGAADAARVRSYRRGFPNRTGGRDEDIRIRGLRARRRDRNRRRPHPGHDHVRGGEAALPRGPRPGREAARPPTPGRATRRRWPPIPPSRSATSASPTPRAPPRSSSPPPRRRWRSPTRPRRPRSSLICALDAGRQGRARPPARLPAEAHRRPSRRRADAQPDGRLPFRPPGLRGGGGRVPEGDRAQPRLLAALQPDGLRLPLHGRHTRRRRRRS